MNLVAELARLLPDRYLALILDNEVTVGEFVIDPPISWTRLIQDDGAFRVAPGYPNRLTEAQAKFEMRNWDSVSLSGIMGALAGLDGGVDYVVFGNNAGQGLPLAQSLRRSLVADHAAIIYANSLPEKRLYEQLGYKNFFRRSEAVSRLGEFARFAGRPLALCFINTIQHNDLNYHDP